MYFCYHRSIQIVHFNNEISCWQLLMFLCLPNCCHTKNDNVEFRSTGSVQIPFSMFLSAFLTDTEQLYIIILVI